MSVRKTKGRFLSNGKVNNRVTIVDWDVHPDLCPHPCDRCKGKHACEYTVSNRVGKCRECRLIGKRCSLGVVHGTTIARDARRNASSAGHLPVETQADDAASPPFHPSVTMNEGLNVSSSHLLVDTLCRDSSSLPIDIRTAASAIPYSSPLNRPSTPVTPSDDVGALPYDGALLAGRLTSASPVQRDSRNDLKDVTVGVQTSLQTETQENEGVFPDSIMGPLDELRLSLTSKVQDLFNGTSAKSIS
ncbi:hypothetical protein EDD85DRAFT_153265 [Armillaria nabsnona]|nr:hypothetical protein EDD85DRAFT_153265 [Armillaria nabsnona]